MRAMRLSVRPNILFELPLLVQRLKLTESGGTCSDIYRPEFRREFIRHSKVSQDGLAR